MSRSSKTLFPPAKSYQNDPTSKKVSLSISRLLIQRFGPGSDCARVLPAHFERKAVCDYYSSVVINMMRYWFGDTTTIQESPPIDLDARYFADLPFPESVEDHFGPLYQRLIPAAERKKNGEFYTPDWLANHLVRIAIPDDEMFRGDNENKNETEKNDAISFGPILDPACGSGTFLLAVIRRMNEFFHCKAGLVNHSAPKNDRNQIDTLFQSLVGFDMNPVAILSAKANLAAAYYAICQCKEIPEQTLENRDSILNQPLDFTSKQLAGPGKTVFANHCSLIVGNPPWINWDRLSLADRDTMKMLWDQYGLFNLSGREARYGGAKKELAALMLLRTIDLYLKQEGRLAMVLPQSVFQTGRSGSGFRRFHLATADIPLGVLRVDDFSCVSVFSGVSTKTATVLIEKGCETKYPVPYFRWSSSSEFVRCQASPIDPNRLDTPWKIELSDHETKTPKTQRKILHDTGSCLKIPSSACQSPETVGGLLKQNMPPLPTSAYRGFIGANTGGANGVYWVEILEKRDHGLVLIRNKPEHGKLPIPQVETEIEESLVFPLLRWGDIDRFSVQTPTLGILLPQDVNTRTGLNRREMESRFPKALEYFTQFEQELRNRAAYQKYQANSPFYSMYNIGPQTVSEYKVVWRRMDSMIRAAAFEPMEHPVLGRRPMIPQETTVLVPCQSLKEAEYLAAMLNSPEVESKVASFSPAGTKGFGSPGILEHLAIPPFIE